MVGMNGALEQEVVGTKGALDVQEAVGMKGALERVSFCHPF